MPSKTENVQSATPFHAAQNISDKSQLSPSVGLENVSRIRKRIIVCCDGTWQNGVESLERWRYSNVLKLARMISWQDERQKPPIPQVVFYQAGIGCDHNLYSQWIEGATGSSLFEKVHETYAFISQNYQQGDEIFLFGFSRGAYTARMTAHFIGEMGILDKHDMDHFEEIFIAYQTKNKLEHRKEIVAADKIYVQYQSQIEKSKRRADVGGNSFSIKCLGVFDTVGSLGLPTELSLTRKAKQLFVFPDNYLGAHIEYGFHAMALNETRVDFDVTLFEQTKNGRDRGQVMKQVWFTGSHGDIGGGYHRHDLSDISLIWMASNIQEILFLDLEYLRGIPEPVASWGAQAPHNSKKGIFKLSRCRQRTLPPRLGKETNEYIHPSVRCQENIGSKVKELLELNSHFVWELSTLEETMKDSWSPVSTPDLGHAHTTKLGWSITSAVNTLLLKLSWNIVGRRKKVRLEDGCKPRVKSRTGWFGTFVTKGRSAEFLSKCG